MSRACEPRTTSDWPRRCARRASAWTRSHPGALVALGTAPEVVGQVAAEHGLALVELGAVARSLEDVFFELTEDQA